MFLRIMAFRASKYTPHTVTLCTMHVQSAYIEPAYK